jgi:hypothetical protein
MRTRRPPDLNLASAPSRADWLSCPCSGTAGKPSVRRIIASLPRPVSARPVRGRAEGAPLRVVHGAREDHDAVLRERVAERDEVHVLLHERDEQVVLQQRRDRLVPARPSARPSQRAGRGGAHLAVTSMRAGSARLARWSFATLVVIVAEKR